MVGGFTLVHEDDLELSQAGVDCTRANRYPTRKGGGHQRENPDSVEPRRLANTEKARLLWDGLSFFRDPRR